MSRNTEKANVSNLWDKVEFFCGNHEKPIPMVIREGQSKFYACSKYMLKDEKHPDGHETGEKACSNRMSFDDAGSIVMALHSAMSNESADPGETIDFNGFSFKYKSYHITVMKYNEFTGKVKLSIINRKAIK